MSKLTDYSKFDHLDTDSSDDEDQEQKNTSPTTNAAPPSPAPNSTPAPAPTSNSQTNGDGTTSASGGTSNAPAGGIFRRHTEHAHRFVFEYPPGNPIYEWEQTLDSITLLIPTPSEVVTRADQLDCRIHPNRLHVGLRIPGNNGQTPFFLDEATAGTLDVHNSTWTWEDGVLTMELFKANKGVVWSSVTLGSKTAEGMTNNSTAAQLDPIQLQEEQKRLLLERWQEENPGMDFRNAEFNGSVPDPRTFMGGVRYD